MQQITIAGQIQLPNDADAIDRIGDALRELSGLSVTQTKGDAWVSFTPFQDIQLSDNGQLRITVVDRSITESQIPFLHDKLITIPRSLLAGLVAVADDKECSVGSPNHAHEVPGIWDSDNGEKAGQPCAECAMYDYARKIIAETA